MSQAYFDIWINQDGEMAALYANLYNSNNKKK